MFRAIGFVIALYAVTILFDEGYDAIERATVATFNTVETAAEVSEQQLIEQTNR